VDRLERLATVAQLEDGHTHAGKGEQVALRLEKNRLRSTAGPGAKL